MAALLGASLNISAVLADTDNGLTIADVAAMEPRERIKYVHRVASDRGLEIAKRHGDTVSQCLRREIVRIERKPDGETVFPRGLQAVIRYVHIANNNGNSSENAVYGIGGIVDLVAERACGLPPGHTP